MQRRDVECEHAFTDGIKQLSRIDRRLSYTHFSSVSALLSFSFFYIYAIYFISFLSFVIFIQLASARNVQAEFKCRNFISRAISYRFQSYSFFFEIIKCQIEKITWSRYSIINTYNFTSAFINYKSWKRRFRFFML